MAEPNDISANIARIESQIAAMDKALEVAQEYPTDITIATKHTREIFTLELARIKTEMDLTTSHWKELDRQDKAHRKEIDALRDKMAAAAFASVGEANDKIERLSNSEVNSLKIQISNLKETVLAIGGKQIAKEGSSSGSASTLNGIAMAFGVFGTVIAIAVGLFALFGTEAPVVQVPATAIVAPDVGR